MCDNNQINTLDVSNLSALITLTCSNNNLTSLDLRNGNNINLVSQYPANPSASPAFDVSNNPNLNCITVDDPIYSTNNWSTTDGFFIDPQHYYDDDCFFSTDINEGEINNNKKAVRIIDILGKETTPSRNTPLFYIYDDGTIEKKIIIK
jgi:Leucine-rich repeat (LRR) protein